jgi:hypothetical protein
MRRGALPKSLGTLAWRRRLQLLTRHPNPLDYYVNGFGTAPLGREVINWSSRPFWPQGLEHPKEAEAVPEGLDWDLWLGPAPERCFNHAYLPFVWRGWSDFGCGALGDMGSYSFDTIFRVLKLEAPVSVEASSSELYEETYPPRVGLRVRGKNQQPQLRAEN